MTAPRAADLPGGSKVRDGSGDLIAVKVSIDKWHVSGLGPFWSYEIDDWLASGNHAKVLRVGDGSGQ